MNTAKVLIALAALALSASASAKTLKIDIDGMVCAFCAQGIEKKMKAQPATDKIFISMEKKVVAIALKPNQDIADAKIHEEIKDAGYVVKGITRTDESFESVTAKVRAAK